MKSLMTERKNKRRRVQLKPDLKTKTEQSHKKQVDANTIARRIKRGEYIDPGQGVYGDFENGIDFQTCMDRITDAREDFSRLPSSLRKRFHNEPAELLDFMANPDNLKEAVSLGLLKLVEAPVVPQTEQTAPTTGATPKTDQAAKEG